MDIQVQRDRSTRSHSATCPGCGRRFSIITGGTKDAPNIERLLRLTVTNHVQSTHEEAVVRSHRGGESEAKVPASTPMRAFQLLVRKLRGK